MSNKRLTIYDIKRLSAKDAPHHFDRATLKAWGQTMKGYKVQKMPDGRYKISQPWNLPKGPMGEPAPKGMTVRYFNPITNELTLN